MIRTEKILGNWHIVRGMRQPAYLVGFAGRNGRMEQCWPRWTEYPVRALAFDTEEDAEVYIIESGIRKSDLPNPDNS